MDQAEKIKTSFHCPKCHHNICGIREVVLPASAFTSIIIPKLGGRFILASCALCGFTEMYDSAAYCEQEDESREKKKSKNIASKPA